MHEEIIETHKATCKLNFGISFPNTMGSVGNNSESTGSFS